MTDFLANSVIFSIALTFVVYFVAQKLYKRFPYFFLTPVLVAVVAIIAVLQCTGISYDQYSKGGDYIGFLLKPAVVALGVPLYLQLEEIRKQKMAVLLSQLIGCVTGIVSVAFFAWIFGASKSTLLSLIPKSVTTPIAMEISSTIGGIPSLTAGVVITVGILGSILGIKFLKIVRVHDPAAMGMAMGTASHGLGTARAAEESQVHGAFGGLGMILNGIFTALLAPWAVKLLEGWM
jgi:predicted murein hydrolase (TIGR00659 family)